jgi:hypothetical protein
MSERTLPSTTYANRDTWSLLWHALASRKMAAVLMVLLAVVTVLTLLFSPQRPAPSADADTLAQWTIDVQARFGPWYDTLATLGVFDIGRAFWSRLLLALGALTLTVGLVDTLAQAVTAWRHPEVRRPEPFSKDASGSSEWQVAQERVTLVEILTQQMAWPVWLPWNRIQIRPHVEETAQATYLYQDWLTWRKMATSIVHLGLIFMLAGSVLDVSLGWRQEGVMLMPGQTVQLAHRSELSLRLEGVEQLGTAAQSTSRIVLESPAETLTGSVAVGRPYAAQGAIVYQRDFGPILRVSARDADGSASGDKIKPPIPLANAATGLEPADEARLSFTQAQAEHYLLMPDIRKVVRLVLYRQGKTWDTHRDELHIEIYGREPEIPESEGDITGDGRVELDGIAYEFAWEQYAILDIVRSPCQWVVRMGAGLTLLGLLAALFIPSARLWVWVVEDKRMSVVRLTGEMPGAGEALTGWRQRLGGDSTEPTSLSPRHDRFLLLLLPVMSLLAALYSLLAGSGSAPATLAYGGGWRTAYAILCGFGGGSLAVAGVAAAVAFGRKGMALVGERALTWGLLSLSAGLASGMWWFQRLWGRSWGDVRWVGIVVAWLVTVAAWHVREEWSGQGWRSTLVGVILGLAGSYIVLGLGSVG